MTPLGTIVTQKVAKRELYKHFNDPEFRADLIKRTNQQIEVYGELAPPSAGQVPGTMSYVYDWYSYDMQTDATTLLATIHMYKRPDGSVGASGEPDPVLLVIDGTTLIDP